MPDTGLQDQLRSDIGVIEKIESDNILRWDGERLYVEQDIYHNGQLVHRKYRRNVTEPVARALSGEGVQSPGGLGTSAKSPPPSRAG